MTGLKKFFNLRDKNEKFADYIKLYNKRKSLLKEADILSEEFSIQKSINDSISADGYFDSSKYKKFLKEHTSKVISKCNDMADIEKSMNKLESDKDCSDIILDAKAILTVKDGFESGLISKSLYFEIIKSKQGEIKFADTIVYNSNGEILLLQRLNSDGGYTGLWGLPGGHVELGEDFKDAGARELFEETGLIVNKENQDGKIIPYEKIGEYKGDYINIEYFITHIDCNNNTPIILDSEEHSAFKWVPLCELDQYEFEYDNMKSNIKRLTGIDSLNHSQVIIKCLQEGIITPVAFKEICDNNPDFIKSVNKHYFSKEERKELSEKREAMEDGSFPIRNEQDLKDAIKSHGLSKDQDKAKEWIKKRAKEIGKEDLIPDEWIEKKEESKIEEPINKGCECDKNIIDSSDIEKAILGVMGDKFEYDKLVLSSISEFVSDVLNSKK